MEKLPNDPQQPMGNRPDSLARTQPGHQGAEFLVKDTPLDLHAGPGTLDQDTPHHAVAFGGTMRVLGSRTLVLTGTHAYPGSQFLWSGERTGLRPHLGDDLLGGGEADSGNLHKPVHGGLMLAQRLSHPGVELIDLAGQQVPLLQIHLQQPVSYTHLTLPTSDLV